MDREDLQAYSRYMFAVAHTREQFEKFVAGKELPEIKAKFEAKQFVGEANLAALEWIKKQEAIAARQDFEAMLGASHRAAEAAAKSARWTMWAAVAAAVGAVATAAGVIVQASAAPPERLNRPQLTTPTPQEPASGEAVPSSSNAKVRP